MESKNAATDLEPLDIPMIYWSLPVISSGEETPDNLEEHLGGHSPVIIRLDWKTTPSPSPGKGANSEVISPPACTQSWDFMIDNALEEDRRLSQVSVDLFSDAAELETDDVPEESFVVPPNRNSRPDDISQEPTVCRRSTGNQGDVSDPETFVPPPNKVSRLAGISWSGQDMSPTVPGDSFEDSPAAAGQVRRVSGQLGSQKGIAPPIGIGNRQSDVPNRICSTSFVDVHSHLQNNTLTTSQMLRQVRRVKRVKSKTPDCIIATTYTSDVNSTLQKQTMSTCHEVSEAEQPKIQTGNTQNQKTPDYITDSSYPSYVNSAFQKPSLTKSQKAKKKRRPKKNKGEKLKTQDFIIDSASLTDNHDALDNDISSLRDRLRSAFHVNVSQKGKSQSEGSTKQMMYSASKDVQSRFQKKTLPPHQKANKVGRPKLQTGNTQNQELKTSDFIIDSSYPSDVNNGFQKPCLARSQKGSKVGRSKIQRGKNKSEELKSQDFITDLTCLTDEHDGLDNNTLSIRDRLRKACRGNASQNTKSQSERSTKLTTYSVSTCPQDVCSSFQNSSCNRQKAMKLGHPNIQSESTQNQELKTSDYIIDSSYPSDVNSAFQKPSLAKSQKAKKKGCPKKQRGKNKSEALKSPDFIIESTLSTCPQDVCSSFHNSSCNRQKAMKLGHPNIQTENTQNQELKTSDYIIDSSYPSDVNSAFQKPSLTKSQKAKKKGCPKKQRGKNKSEVLKSPDFIIDSTYPTVDHESLGNNTLSVGDGPRKSSGGVNTSQKRRDECEGPETQATETHFTYTVGGCSASCNNPSAPMREALSVSTLITDAQKGKASKTTPRRPAVDQTATQSQGSSRFSQQLSGSSSQSRQSHESPPPRFEPLPRQTLRDVTSLDLPSRAEFFPVKDLPPGFWDDPDADWPQEWVDDLELFENSF